MFAELDCGVLVAGAGLSGLCAALAAARAGQRVILVGDRPMLGGNSSSEIRMWTRGATGGGNLFGEEMGLLGELKMRNLLTNPKGNPFYWDEVLFEAIYNEPNLTLLLNTHVMDVERSDDRVTAVRAYQLGTEKQFRLTAEYFIDATGDGLLGAAAGVPYYFGEGSAPIEGFEMPETKPVLGSSIYYFIKRCDGPVPFIAPDYAYPMEYIQGVIDRGGRIVDEKHSGADYWWFEFGGLQNTITNNQEITLELKKFALGAWNYVKNSGKFDADNLTLEWIGNVAAKRESRRMITDYMLTQEDVLGDAGQPDDAFYGGWFIDFHPSDGIYSQEEFCTQQPVQCYPVPLRTLFNSKMPNVLFAGRIIGASRAAFASTRVMNTCALSGQAAGTLAACCIERGLRPGEVAADLAPEMRQRLLRDDVWVLGCRNEDPADQARTASVSADSWLGEWTASPSGDFSLQEDAFLCFPAAKGVGQATVRLAVQEATTLDISLYLSPLPSRRCPGAPLVQRQLALAPGQDVTLEWPAGDQNSFVLVYITANPHVAVRTTDWAPTGFLLGGRMSMAHCYPCVQLPLGDLYIPGQVISGYNRPYEGPGLWVAQTPKAQLRLDWPSAVTIGEVWLYTNPDLTKELPNAFAAEWSEHHMMVGRDGWPPELARDFTIRAQVDGAWVTLAEARGNWRRLWKGKLAAPVIATALTIDFHSDDARGPVPAQLFEVRIY